MQAFGVAKLIISEGLPCVGTTVIGDSYDDAVDKAVEWVKLYFPNVTETEAEIREFIEQNGFYDNEATAESIQIIVLE